MENEKDSLSIKLELAAKAIAEDNTGIEAKMSSHKNCIGCPSEPACGKTVGLMLSTFSRNPAKKMQEVLNSSDPTKINYDFKDIEDVDDEFPDYRELSKDFDEDDEFDYPDYEEKKVSPEKVAYARSLVGKWVTCDELSHLGHLLALVVAQNDYSRGGNPEQVRIIPFKQKELFNLNTWKNLWQIKVIEGETIDSAWLKLTDERPELWRYLVTGFYLIARSSISFALSTAFSLRTYEHFGRDWTNANWLANLCEAGWDTISALKYGLNYKYEWRMH